MTIELLPEIAQALADGRGVVALESTLLCHGLPRPDNAAVAGELEQVVRDRGAMPATVAAIDGKVNVGLCRSRLDRLLEAPEVAKCTTRDLPLVLAERRLGATTIAATIFVAARVGIRVMATGGLGGVHLGGESSLDVSADLEELARQPVTVVCSGVKSILDQRRTLERLETLGVPVVGYGCDELPGFYTAQSGIAVPAVAGPGDALSPDRPAPRARSARRHGRGAAPAGRRGAGQDDGRRPGARRANGRQPPKASPARPDPFHAGPHGARRAAAPPCGSTARWHAPTPSSPRAIAAAQAAARRERA